MCSIVVINHHFKEFPLIIAANRDELHSRRSEPVQILDQEHTIIGGKDKKSGGTWLAVNKHSLFVAITNQGTKEKGKPSRGAIALEALKCKSLDELVSFVEELDPSKFSGFNIVFGNHTAMFVGHSYLLHSMVIHEIPYGVNLITSDFQFTGATAKSVFMHKKLDKMVDMPWLEYYKELKLLLANSKYGFKVRAETNDAGKRIGRCTHSSSILAFSNEGLARFKYYDRMDKTKRQDDEPFHRYKDYIDMWRGTATSELKPQASEETGDENEEGEEEKPSALGYAAGFGPWSNSTTYRWG